MKLKKLIPYVVAGGLALGVGCDSGGESAYMCRCPAVNEQRGASGTICAATAQEAEEMFSEEHGCYNATCHRESEIDYLCR